MTPALRSVPSPEKAVTLKVWSRPQEKKSSWCRKEKNRGLMVPYQRRRRSRPFDDGRSMSYHYHTTTHDEEVNMRLTETEIEALAAQGGAWLDHWQDLEDELEGETDSAT
jgi:hypothetical protein